MYQNITSIKGRVDEFKNLQNIINEFDILALVETNLDDDIKNDELGLQDFNLYRCDRNVFNSVKKTGGGVLLAIRKSIISSELHLKSQSFEQVSVKMNFGDKNIFIGLIYFPPNSVFAKYNDYINEIQDFILTSTLSTTFDDIIILGDFNLAGYEWNRNKNYSFSQGYNSSASIRESTELMSNFCEIYKIFQYNTFKNSYNSILDLVFSNISSLSLCKADDYFFDNTVFHCALSITFTVNLKKINNNNYEKLYYNFNEGDYQNINNKLIEIDWDKIFDNDTENSVVKFNEIIFKLIIEFIPKKK